MENKRIFATILIALLVVATDFIHAADTHEVELKYRRSSIYSILLNNESQQFANDIRQQFLKIPVSERYNDHSLSITTLSIENNASLESSINTFLEANKVASRMVAKWFNRDTGTGVCNMNLIKARGVYDASVFDQELAANTIRGKAMLEDAGEDLIANTFLLINEVNYINKNDGAKIAGGVLAVLGALGGGIASAITGNDRWMAVGSAAGVAAGAITATYKGFRVIITTRLYQLIWDEDTAMTFYQQYYSEKPDEAKRKAFERDRGKFKLKYIGKVNSSGSDVSFLGINEKHPEIMVRKACQRAIDENIVDLQHAYEQFRVKSPVLSCSPELTVPIGKKEGVEKTSKYEVLQPKEKDGRVEYVRVGVIKPNPSKIWDNRFMAREEGAEGSDLGATTFIVVSGNSFSPGMLIREI